MNTQIIFIHGGNSFSSYDAYLHNLKIKTIWDPTGVVKQKRWKDTLIEEFGDTCDIFFPSMPNSQNARYIEWKIWFERYFEYVSGEAILIGHSLGGFFLTKYLTENSLPFHVKALYLIASPFQPDEFNGEDCADFAFDAANLYRIKQSVGTINILHSTDDTIVPYSHAEMFHVALPTANMMVFHDRGHFLGETFPEIIKDIQKHI